MSSSPDTTDPFTTTVKRVPDGAMSNWMNDVLTPGDTIDVLRPSGLFVLRESDTPIVAFAGGSGITPVISIIKSALTTTERPIVLVYANRGEDAVIFADELERLASKFGDRLSVRHHLDSERGFLDAVQCAEHVGEATHADFYICGPGPYMDTVEAGLSTLDVAPDQVFIERFVLSEPAPEPAGAGASETESVVIKLEKQETVAKYKAGDTILNTARSAGLSPPFSCEQGNCATCMAHLDAGSVTMRVNNALTAEEVDEGWILTCQSLPTTQEIIVDYDA
jgi:ferredoxin-NADP reductase